MVSQVYERLSAVDKWLLVFDNADKYEDILPYIPTSLNKGHNVMVTCLNEGSSPDIPVNSFSAEESAAYIKQYLPNANAGQIAELAKLLNYLPLDLKGAINYIRSAGISTSEYIKTASETNIKLILEEDGNSNPSGNLQRAVSTTTTSNTTTTTTAATTTTSKGLGAIAKHHKATNAWQKFLESTRDCVKDHANTKSSGVEAIKVFISYAPEDTSTTDIKKNSENEQNNTKVGARIERLVSDLKQVGMEVYYDKDISNNPGERQAQIKASDVIIPIITDVATVFRTKFYTAR